MSKRLTAEETVHLMATQSQEEWDAQVQAIKAARGGYLPFDWDIKLGQRNLPHALAWCPARAERPVPEHVAKARRMTLERRRVLWEQRHGDKT